MRTQSFIWKIDERSARGKLPPSPILSKHELTVWSAVVSVQFWPLHMSKGKNNIARTAITRVPGRSIPQPVACPASEHEQDYSRYNCESQREYPVRYEEEICTWESGVQSVLNASKDSSHSRPGSLSQELQLRQRFAGERPGLAFQAGPPCMGLSMSVRAGPGDQRLGHKKNHNKTTPVAQ